MIEFQITYRSMSDEVRSRCIFKQKEIFKVRNWQEYEARVIPTKQEYRDHEIRKIYFKKNRRVVTRPIYKTLTIIRLKKKLKLKDYGRHYTTGTKQVKQYYPNNDNRARVCVQFRKSIGTTIYF